MRTIAIIVAIILSSCGSANDGSGDSFQVAGSQVKPSPSTAPDQTHAMQTAELYNLETDLPDCDASNKGALAYLIVREQFQACDGSQWAVVNIRGEKGDPGVDGKPIPTTEWNDPVTGKLWMITGSISTSATFGACGETEWRDPTLQEMKTACAHGLFQRFPGQYAWSDHSDVFVSNGCYDTTFQIGTHPGSMPTFCIHK